MREPSKEKQPAGPSSQSGILSKRKRALSRTVSPYPSSVAPSFPLIMNHVLAITDYSPGNVKNVTSPRSPRAENAERQTPRGAVSCPHQPAPLFDVLLRKRGVRPPKPASAGLPTFIGSLPLRHPDYAIFAPPGSRIVRKLKEPQSCTEYLSLS
jgi:hypothetical protein